MSVHTVPYGGAYGNSGFLTLLGTHTSGRKVEGTSRFDQDYVTYQRTHVLILGNDLGWG